MKKILLITLLLALTSGCQSIYETEDAWGTGFPVIVELEQVIYWLQAANDSIQLSPQQAQQRLDKFSLMKKTRFNYFRYALLNQQLGTRDGWERARDTLRNLGKDKSINEDLMWIIRIHLHYNQALINNHARVQELTAKLDQSKQSQKLLEDKINAITHLEQSISERKEQATEDVKAVGAVSE